MKSVALHNLGCKVNGYEMDVMQQRLQENGYKIVPFDEPADIYIVNTCTVTNIADRKSRQMLHRAKKQNPDAVVVAVGCYVQVSEAAVRADDAVDLVIGNDRKKDLVAILEAYLAGQECGQTVIDINHTAAYEVRSRGQEDVLREVRGIVDAGYQEIVLTGIHISSYGMESGEAQLAELLEKLQAVDGLKRIRLGSLEPRIVTEGFVERLRSMPKICPHFHLSLQSGSDTVLARMNRHYTSGEYFRTTEIIRKYYPAPAITTDVIVGFPGETEEEMKSPSW